MNNLERAAQALREADQAVDAAKAEVNRVRSQEAEAVRQKNVAYQRLRDAQDELWRVALDAEA